MDVLFADYLERMDSLHRSAAEAIRGLPVEALDWSPGPAIPSLAVLVAHMAGSERYWIGDVGMGELSGRDRQAEFRTRGLEVSALLQRLDASLAYARRALDRLDLTHLSEARTEPREGRVYTVAWALLHALEHTGVHTGHIQIVRQLWDERGG